MYSPVFSGNPSFSNSPLNITFNITPGSNDVWKVGEEDEADLVFVCEADEKKYDAHLGDDSIYQIRHHPKGRVLLINNEFNKSRKLIRRRGSRMDVRKMSELWDDIGCDVTIKRDLPAKKILRVVRDFVKDDADLVVIAIMSHGVEDDLILGEDEGCTEVEKIVECVVNSDKLKGKPKLLFFQMCRGKKLTKTHTDAGTMDTKDSAWVLTMLNKLLPKGRILGSKRRNIDATEGRFSNEYLDGREDTLIAFASMPDYQSFRDVETGSWFIQSLVNVFKTQAHEVDVVTMMEDVKKEVKKKSANAPGKDHHECVARVDGSDTFGEKKLFLFPGFPRPYKE